MTIYGIEGGIGTGKTLLAVHLTLDKLKEGKKIYSNVKLHESIENVEYLSKEFVNDMFKKIKTGELDMRNSVVLIQEMHNYMDSRSSMSKKNKTLSYWILQSRHTGKGSCDIIYDTQDLMQVDKRLRINTDEILQPYIVSWNVDEKGNKKPQNIVAVGQKKCFHRYVKFVIKAYVLNTVGLYDTHEVVDF